MLPSVRASLVRALIPSTTCAGGYAIASWEKKRRAPNLHGAPSEEGGRAECRLPCIARQLSVEVQNVGGGGSVATSRPVKTSIAAGTLVPVAGAAIIDGAGATS